MSTQFSVRASCTTLRLSSEADSLDETCNKETIRWRPSQVGWSPSLLVYDKKLRTSSKDVGTVFTLYSRSGPSHPICLDFGWCHTRPVQTASLITGRHFSPSNIQEVHALGLTVH